MGALPTGGLRRWRCSSIQPCKLNGVSCDMVASPAGGMVSMLWSVTQHSNENNPPGLGHDLTLVILSLTYPCQLFALWQGCRPSRPAPPAVDSITIDTKTCCGVKRAKLDPRQIPTLPKI